MRKVLHLHIKATGEDKYYGSMVALCEDNKQHTELCLSKYNLDRWDFTNPFENDQVRIKKGLLVSTTHVRKKNK